MRHAAALLAALATVLAAPSSAADASGRRWVWPVRGEILTPFAASANPFARRQHRGIDIAARAGAPVRAACGGKVTFAGRLPGRGRAVTVRCGAFAATHLELGSSRVERGALVAAGTPIGTVAASHVQLGARRLGHRHGYVDPRRLLGADPARPGVPAPPLGGRVPRGGPPPAPPLPELRPTPAAAPAPAAPRDAPATPLAAWLGLAAIAAATPLGALARSRARRRRGATRAPVAAGPGR